MYIYRNTLRVIRYEYSPAYLFTGTRVVVVLGRIYGLFTHSVSLNDLQHCRRCPCLRRTSRDGDKNISSIAFLILLHTVRSITNTSVYKCMGGHHPGPTALEKDFDTFTEFVVSNVS